jgi:hypothetical protein
VDLFLEDVCDSDGTSTSAQLDIRTTSVLRDAIHISFVGVDQQMEWPEAREYCRSSACRGCLSAPRASPKCRAATAGHGAGWAASRLEAVEL